MVYAVIKAVHFLGLCLVLGGPFFWVGIWQRVYGSADEPASTRMAHRIRGGVWVGAGLFILSGLADIVRAASQVVDPTVPGDLWLFLSASRYGHMTILKLSAVAVGASCFIVAGRLPGRLLRLGTAVCGLLTLAAISLGSHAAARPGLVPLINDMVHLLGVVVWGGGLLYFALVPWAVLQDDLKHHTPCVGRMIEHFSTLALLAVCGLALTGALNTFWHVYGVTAFTQTPYGRTLLGKLILFGLALAIATSHVLVISPAYTRQARRFVQATAQRLLRRFAYLVRAEAVLVLASACLAGVLTTLPPAERSGQIVRHAWQRTLGAVHMHLQMAPTDELGTVQLNLMLQDEQQQALPSETRVFLLLRMVDHDMGLARIAAQPTAAGQYTASGLVSMAGPWQLHVTVQPPQSPALTTVVDFEAPTGTLERDRIRRLDLAAIGVSLLNTLSCVLGLLLGSLAILTLWASRGGKLPLWSTPVGIFLLACGSYLVLSIVLVDAYPTTYMKNPVPVSAEIVTRGQQTFQTHCAVCHGSTGRGDGPAAAALNPPPADLTASHVDNHTDGDLFWWLTHGIAGTAMPAWEEALSETRRWEVIHYVRSLRHEKP